MKLWVLLCAVCMLMIGVPAEAAETPPSGATVWDAPAPTPAPEPMALPPAARPLVTAGGVMSLVGAGLVVGSLALGQLSISQGFAFPYGWGVLAGAAVALPGPALMLQGAKLARSVDRRAPSKRERIGTALYFSALGVIGGGAAVLALGLFSSNLGLAILGAIFGVAAAAVGAGLWVTSAIFSFAGARNQLRQSGVVVVPWMHRDGTGGLALAGRF